MKAAFLCLAATHGTKYFRPERKNRLPTQISFAIISLVSSTNKGEQMETTTINGREYQVQIVPGNFLKAREAAIRANAQAWSKLYDGHSMVVLRKPLQQDMLQVCRSIM